MFNLLSLPNCFLKVSTKYAVILRIVIQIAVGPKTSSEKLLIEKAKKWFFFPYQFYGVRNGFTSLNMKTKNVYHSVTRSRVDFDNNHIT